MSRIVTLARNVCGACAVADIAAVRLLRRCGFAMTPAAQLLLLCLSVWACAHAPDAAPPSDVLSSVLVSAGSALSFCNGEAMDSDGYRRSLTVARPVSLPKGATVQSQVDAVVDSLTSGACKMAVKNHGIHVSDGAAHIAPLDTWAGVSIAMCSCTPELEVNLVRIPGVRRVVWDPP
jgi:hypothetical protein